MGTKIYTGRHTVDSEVQDDFVVFMIGMRINKWWAVHKWLPVVLAMSPMIKELYMNKEHGFISMENFLGYRTTLLVQYWRSEEQLLSYAKGKTHMKAWKEFYKKVGNNDAVGIFHETYTISKGNYEAFYGNMPKFGLTKAFGIAPVTSRTNTAAERIGKDQNTNIENSVHQVGAER